jgi:benzil reductase ((S)-benzoin forming)
MKTFIITGTSSGIGRALALFYLEKGNRVIGLSRRNDLTHPQFTFIQTDLSTTTDFIFLNSHIHQTEELVLINNAGVIGNIERISEQKQSDIAHTLQVNTIAPLLLMQYVLQARSIDLPLSIVNISSGAGKRPIPSWASYCASKAAIDLFSETVYLEEKERNRLVKIYSVAPGVVDTSMQEKIRQANAADFSSLDNFVQLKNNNELTNTALICRKLDHLLQLPYSGQVIYSLRDIDI